MRPSTLPALLHSRESSLGIHFLLDSVQQSANFLLAAAVAASFQLGHVALCCLEQPSALYAPASADKLTVIDFRDRWDAEPFTTTTPSSWERSFERIAGAIRQDAFTTVVIDSLNIILRTTPLPHLLRMLSDLKSKLDASPSRGRIFLRYHEDIPFPSTGGMSIKEAFYYVGSSFLWTGRVGPPESAVARRDRRAVVCEVEVRKKTGGLTKETVVCLLDTKSWKILEMEKLVAETAKPAQARSGKDPTSNLTFDLTLTEDQKAARAKVVLPFLRSSEDDKGGAAVIHDDDEDDEEDLEV